MRASHIISYSTRHEYLTGSRTIPHWSEALKIKYVLAIINLPGFQSLVIIIQELVNLTLHRNNRWQKIRFLCNNTIKFTKSQEETHDCVNI